MTEPSKVIHVRNVGLEIAEADLLQLIQPFGVASKVVMLRAKNQALVQMHDVASAVSALQYYSTVQPSVRGRNVYLQFSSHQELTTADQNAQGRKSDQDSQPNRILLVTIHHMIYPITVEVLHQVFSPHGFVEKIVTFQKTAGFQALIQFQSRQSALQARTSLQGRNIYDGCCQLDIQFSNLNELQVNCNNDRSRDFTNPSLPTEQRGRSSQVGYGDGGGIYALQPGSRVAFAQMGNAAAIAAAFGGGLPPGITGTNDRCTILATNLNPEGAMLFGKKMEVNFSKYPNITPAPDTHEYANSSLNRFHNNAIKNYRYCCAPTKMIHLSSLPHEIAEDEVVAHVEEHGSVVNSKLYEVNGKKQALVQFENEEQATEALVCKHATTLDRCVIRISFSQLQSI
ncbi:polypyrimidine tract-binding protein homolog 3-like isoform X2 [Carex rostrata]